MMSRLVEIATFYSPEEAYCAQGALRSGGCFTLLSNEHHLNVAPSLRVGLGGYRLLVLEEDANDIRLALKNLPAPANDQPSFEDRAVEKPVAPRRKNWLWLPVALSAAVPFLPDYKNARAFWWQILVSAPFYFMIALWLFQLRSF